MQKILIVVDMQNDFVDGALGTKKASAIVDQVAQKIQTFDGDIIITYDTHDENYMDTREGKYLPIPHCIKGTNGWKLNKHIQNALRCKKYVSFEKPSFGSLELIRYLKENYMPNEMEIELCGLCSDICVISNALLIKAAFTETGISVTAALCAGATPESHLAALTTMKMCQITIK